MTSGPLQHAWLPFAPAYTWLLLQQKLLGPTAVCPEGQLEFEHAALATSAPTVQHLPLIWMLGLAHCPQAPVVMLRV